MHLSLLYESLTSRRFLWTFLWSRLVGILWENQAHPYHCCIPCVYTQHLYKLYPLSPIHLNSFWILSLDLWGFYLEPVIVILRIYHNVFVYCSSATHKIIPQKSAFVDCFYRFLRIFVEYLCLGGKIMPHMLHSSHELSYMWKFWKVFRTYIFYDKIWILLRHLNAPKIV